MFVAMEPALGRTVVVKVLPPELKEPMPRQQNRLELWRATVFAALGDKFGSFAQLRLAVPTAGRTDWDLHDEPIYELMRDHAPFEEYIKPKG